MAAAATRRTTSGRWTSRRAQFASTALGLYQQTPEALEGRNAFVEKRPVDFRKFRG